MSFLRRIRRRIRRRFRRIVPPTVPAPGDRDERMTRHEFLRELHRVVAPRNYLEIGVNDGRSLALARVRSIAVDPAFKITVPIRCDLDLVKATSDDFFAQPDPLAHFRASRDRPEGRPRAGGPSDDDPGCASIDLAFIDGMHLLEFALRDFMNVERHSDWWSVIVFDDMLPRSADEAARDRHTRAWAGDVFKMVPVLARYRPDLIVIPVDTQPTGVLVVLGADPQSTVLRERYEEILAEWVAPDPQQVPREIIERRAAVVPEGLLAAELWADLVRARGSAATDVHGRDLLRQRAAAIVSGVRRT